MRIGEILLEQGKVSPANIREALLWHELTGIMLGKVLVGLRYVNTADVEQAVIEQQRRSGQAGASRDN
jgi:hypothetical protein